MLYVHVCKRFARLKMCTAFIMCKIYIYISRRAVSNCATQKRICILRGETHAQLSLYLQPSVLSPSAKKEKKPLFLLFFLKCSTTRDDSDSSRRYRKRPYIASCVHAQGPVSLRTLRGGSKTCGPAASPGRPRARFPEEGGGGEAGGRARQAAFLPRRVSETWGGRAGTPGALGGDSCPRGDAVRAHPCTPPNTPHHGPGRGGGGRKRERESAFASAWGRGGERSRLACSVLGAVSGERDMRSVLRVGVGVRVGWGGPAAAAAPGGGAGRGRRERANVFIRFSGWAVKAHA